MSGSAKQSGPLRNRRQVWSGLVWSGASPVQVSRRVGTPIVLALELGILVPPCSDLAGLPSGSSEGVHDDLTGCRL